MANISHFGVLSIITQQTEFSQSSAHLNYVYVEVRGTRFINVAILKACTRNNLYRSKSQSATEIWTVWTTITEASYIGNERLDILGTYKELHEALLEIVRFCNSRLAHRQRILQAFHEFRSHLNNTVNNRDVSEKHLQRKIQERN